VPSQALQVIFEMQSQRSRQKIAVKKKKKIKSQIVFFFSFFFILTPPTSSVHNFLILFFQIERFKPL
jgi:hypothetical protein